MCFCLQPNASAMSHATQQPHARHVLTSPFSAVQTAPTPFLAGAPLVTHHPVNHKAPGLHPHTSSRSMSSASSMPAPMPSGPVPPPMSEEAAVQRRSDQSEASSPVLVAWPLSAEGALCHCLHTSRGGVSGLATHAKSSLVAPYSDMRVQRVRFVLRAVHGRPHAPRLEYFPSLAGRLLHERVLQRSSRYAEAVTQLLTDSLTQRDISQVLADDEALALKVSPGARKRSLLPAMRVIWRGGGVCSPGRKAHLLRPVCSGGCLRGHTGVCGVHGTSCLCG